MLLEENTTEQKWQKVEGAVTSTCQEVLGSKSYIHKEWMSAETLQKVEETREKKEIVNNSRTRAAKLKAQEEYKANVNVLRSIRSDARKYLKTLAAEAEKSAYQNRTKDLFSIIKRLAAKFVKPDRPVWDKHGGVMTDD